MKDNKLQAVIVMVSLVITLQSFAIRSSNSFDKPVLSITKPFVLPSGETPGISPPADGSLVELFRNEEKMLAHIEQDALEEERDAQPASDPVAAAISELVREKRGMKEPPAAGAATETGHPTPAGAGRGADAAGPARPEASSGEQARGTACMAETRGRTTTAEPRQRGALHAGEGERRATEAPSSTAVRKARGDADAYMKYTVRKGDSLWKLARRFSCKIGELIIWNNLESTTLRPGMTLRIRAKSQPAPGSPETDAGRGGLVYTVRKGDTLSSIARRFNVPISALILSNGISPHSVLKPGQRIAIPAPRTIIHVVEKGESLWGIANRYGISMRKLREANPRSASGLKPGMRLEIPVDNLDTLRRNAYRRHPAAGRNKSKRRKAGKRRFIKPVSGSLTDKFGWRIHPIFHRRLFHHGIDLRARIGTPIHATADGKVVFSGRLKGYGNTIVIRHADGFSSRYAHCHKLLKHKGDRVRQGDVIATVGNTGLSTGPHLHFEIRRYGVPQNPVKYLGKV